MRRLVMVTAMMACGVVLAVAAWVAMPMPRALLARRPAPAVTLEDRNGLVLRTTRAADGSRTSWMPLGEMDSKLITAFVAVEDRRFFQHGALDWRALARAALANARAGHVVSGASTLAMQTARLLHPSGRTWSGKVVQLLWALRLSAHLDRQQILEQYLNRVHLGQGAVGVASAAALYFGASARDLSVGQAALLAGIAHAPSSDNPLVSARRARASRERALRRMARAGYVDEAALARAREEPVVAMPDGAPFLAPHFTTRVLLWETSASDTGSSVWRTSLDFDLQRDIEAEVRRTTQDLHQYGGEQAAAVVLDNRTGEILAWVGSPDFQAEPSGQTDMVVSPRQPGSALKPFLYGLAFDRGLTAASVLADIPHSYRTSTGPYHPRNYDHRFHGPVRVREALASSFNVPAVEVAARVGTGSLLETLRLAGFASLSRTADHYGLGLALGNGDVTLLELANGYRALATNGVWHPVTWRLVAGGAAAAGDARRVMTARAAALVLDILSDPAARVAGFGLQTPLEFPFRAAAKTGTSRHFTDNWAVATTMNFTVAVWVGNFSGRPMDGVSGVTGAGPLLHRAVLATARRYPPGALPTPQAAGLVPAEICRLSGLRATDGCPHLTEWFVPGNEPIRADDWYHDGHVVLPPDYAAWLEQRDAEDDPPAGAMRVAITQPLREPLGFHISSPRDGDRYQVPPGVDARYSTIALRVAGAAPSRTVAWTVDGRGWRASRLPLSPGAHVIRASDGPHTDEVTITVGADAP